MGLRSRHPDLKVFLFNDPVAVLTHSHSLARMCFSMLPPQTPSTDSEASSSSLPTASLPTQQFGSNCSTTVPEGSIRKRVVRACEVCRRKKVKCNGQKPCSQCIAFAEECTYVDVRDRSAYSRRYVESLEARLAELERRVNILSERKPCDGSCQLRPITDMHRSTNDPGAASTFPGQGQAEEPETSISHRKPPSEECEQAPNLGLEHSIDLTSLSAPSLLMEAHATLFGPNQQGLSVRSSCETVQGETRQRVSTSTIRQPPNDVKHELDIRPVTPEIPSKSTFLALLHSYSQHLFPFYPITPPLEAESVWNKVASPQPSLITYPASEVALLLAVMACGALVDSRTRATRIASANQYDASARRQNEPFTGDFEKHAVVWARKMGAANQHDHAEASRQSQVYALLSYCSASRGDLLVAFSHITEAHTALGLSSLLSAENRIERLRLSTSIKLLHHTILSSLGRLATHQQDPLGYQASRSASMHRSGSHNICSALQHLSALCSETGCIGRTLCDLLDLTSASAPVDQVRACARNQDRLLLNWYSGLPEAFRSAPNDASDPTTATAACIASVSLQFERLRLHLALQLFNRRTADSTSESERLDLDRCMQVAGSIIQTFPTINRYLPQGPWLMLYSQSLGMSAAFLVLTAARQPHYHVLGLLGQVDMAVAALAQLEHTIMGVADTRLKLARLASAIRSRKDEAPGPNENKRRASEQGNHLSAGSSARGEGPSYKKVRASTMPQNSPIHVVSPISRPETAPPVPHDHPPIVPNASLAGQAVPVTPPRMHSQDFAHGLWQAFSQDDPGHTGSTIDCNDLLPGQASEPHVAAQQQQQQQFATTVAPQAHGLPLNFDQQGLVGFLDDLMLADLQIRRQGK